MDKESALIIKEGLLAIAKAIRENACETSHLSDSVRGFDRDLMNYLLSKK